MGFCRFLGSLLVPRCWSCGSHGSGWAPRQAASQGAARARRSREAWGEVASTMNDTVKRHVYIYIVNLLIYLLIYLINYLSIYLFTCSSMYLSIHVHIYSYMYLDLSIIYIYSFIYIHSFRYLCVYIYIYQSSTDT